MKKPESSAWLLYKNYKINLQNRKEANLRNTIQHNHPPPQPKPQNTLDKDPSPVPMKPIILNPQKARNILVLGHIKKRLVQVKKLQQPLPGTQTHQIPGM